MNPATARHEPEESDNPLNGLLHAFEVQVEAMKRNGLEAPMRARLARVLPPEPAAALELSIVLTALKLNSRARRTEAEFAANRRAREIVIQLMEAA